MFDMRPAFIRPPKPDFPKNRLLPLTAHARARAWALRICARRACAHAHQVHGEDECATARVDLACDVAGDEPREKAEEDEAQERREQVCEG